MEVKELNIAFGQLRGTFFNLSEHITPEVAIARAVYQFVDRVT